MPLEGCFRLTELVWYCLSFQRSQYISARPHGTVIPNLALRYCGNCTVSVKPFTAAVSPMADLREATP